MLSASAATLGVPVRAIGCHLLPVIASEVPTAWGRDTRSAPQVGRLVDGQVSHLAPRWLASLPLYSSEVLGMNVSYHRVGK